MLRRVQFMYTAKISANNLSLCSVYYHAPDMLMLYVPITYTYVILIESIRTLINSPVTGQTYTLLCLLKYIVIYCILYRYSLVRAPHAIKFDKIIRPKTCTAESL